jgi:UDP:flavonoid glycosyltransferase YjiC (YdhE family)
VQQVDILISNGGYGAVQHALRLGIPMVVSGISEDKATTNSIVQWSGVGIDLGEQSPGAEKIGEAVAKMLGDDSYKNKAKTLSKEYEKYDVGKTFDKVIQDAYRDWRKKRAGAKSEL